MKKLFSPVGITLLLFPQALAQNVGVGTAVTSAKLDIENTGTVPGLEVYSTSASSGSPNVRLVTYSTSAVQTGIENTVSGTGNGSKVGLNNSLTLNAGTTGFSYGTINNLNVNGSASWHYGTYNSITGVTAPGTLAYGVYSSLSATAGSITGSFTGMTGNGNAVVYGSYNSISGPSASDHSGTNNYLSGTGVGNKIGCRNIFQATSAGPSYAVYNGLLGNSNDLHYGTYNLMTGTGTGAKTGLMNSFTSGVGGIQYGVRNEMLSSSNDEQQGLSNVIYGSGTGLKTGLYNGFFAAAGGTQYGVYNALMGSTDNPHAGIMNYVSGTGNGPRYGTYTTITATESGTGQKFGTLAYIDPAAGGTHYGVYSSATKSGSYAGYFLGNVTIGTTFANTYTLPPSRGTADQVMQTDGSGNVSWVDPSTVSDGDWNVVGSDQHSAVSGNVGIGTSAPASKFHVISTGSSPARFEAPSSMYMSLYEGGTYRGYWGSYSGSAEDVDFGTGAGNSTGKVHLALQASPVLTVAPGGDVGIGTTAPGATLDVRGDAIFNELGGNNDFRIEADLEPDMFVVDASANNLGIGRSPTATYMVDMDAVNYARGINIDMDHDISGQAFGTRVFLTESYSASQNVYGTWSEIYRYNPPSDGESWAGRFHTGDYQTGTGTRKAIGIEATVNMGSTLGTSTAHAIEASVSGNADIEYAGYFSGDVYTTGSYLPSDERLKQDVAPFDSALASLQSLVPVSYQYQTDVNPHMNLPEEPQIGFTAQNVEEAFPQLVKRTLQSPQRLSLREAKELGLDYVVCEDDPEYVLIGQDVEFKAVNYTGLIPVLVKAIQELAEQNDQLRTRIEELESR